MITLVLGGTRSGKSAVAEQLAAASGAPVTYLATADPAADPDLGARVAQHRARRPASWVTVESGLALPDALRAHGADTALVDSLGTWVAAHRDLQPDVEDLVAALRSRTGATVVVSEEVGMAVHPTTDVGRQFVDALGHLNVAVADLADTVLLVVAGRVLALDRLPAAP